MRYKFIWFVLIVLFGCKSVIHKQNEFYTSDGHKIKISYYKDGQIQSKNIFLNDSILDGEQIEYFDNGIMSRDYFYKNGLKDSICYNYFANGRLSEKSSWHNGQHFGAISEYDDNGNIETYQFYTPDDKLYYEKDYDSTGKVLLENGIHLPMTILLENKRFADLRKGDTVKFQAFAVRPPNLVNSLLVNFSEENQNISTKWVEVRLDKTGGFTFGYKFPHEGKYILTEKLSFYDSVTNITTSQEFHHKYAIQ